MIYIMISCNSSSTAYNTSNAIQSDHDVLSEHAPMPSTPIRIIDIIFNQGCKNRLTEARRSTDVKGLIDLGRD